MRKFMFAAALSALSVAAAPASAQTTTINFEGFSAFTPITNQYAANGVTFAGAAILTAPGYNTTSYPPRSGVNVVYNQVGNISLTFASTVSNLFAFASTSQTLTLSVFGTTGNLLGTSTLGSNLGTNSSIGFQGSGIASAIFSNGGSNNLTLDDISFNAAVAAVPEPATWGLMILGFGAVGAAMRRRNAVRTTVSFA